MLGQRPVESLFGRLKCELGAEAFATRGQARAVSFEYRKWPKTPYRRQIVKRFRKKPKRSRHRRVFGQRWQVESAFSRHKRRLGSALGGRSDASRERECQLRVLTHNLMLLAAHRWVVSTEHRDLQA